MASSFIPIIRNDPTAPFAVEMLSLSQQARSFWELLRKTRDKGFQMIGSPANFAEYAQLYGIPPASAQTVFDMINSIFTVLDANPKHLESFINRVG